MRVIINNLSDRAYKAAGWRAKAVSVNDRNEASLAEVLKSVPLKDGTSMFDLITVGSTLKGDWTLYVNGSSLPGSALLDVIVKDSTQVHVKDRGISGENR